MCTQVFAGSRAYLKRFFRDTLPAPDFEQIVKVVLATFAVFTGFVLSGYIKEKLVLPELTDWSSWLSWFGEWRLWAFFALMALLLRYIIGSAIHLNFMYVPVKRENQPPQARSQSVVFLFKDLVFLVIFGLIAMSVSAAVEPVSSASTTIVASAPKSSANIDAFMQRAMLFVGAGFAWSLFDAGLRGLWGLKWENEKPGYFWILWASLDLLLFVMTLAILRSGGTTLSKAVMVALLYLLFLFLDVKAAIRAVQLRVADEAAAAAAAAVA